MVQLTNEGFLRGIFAGEWEDAHVTGFAEDPGGLEALGLKHYWAGTKWRRYQNRAALRTQNAYFTISMFGDDPDGKAKRRKALFRATYAIVVDDVGTKVKEADVLARWPEPSWKLETSPGNFQWGYILNKPEWDAGRVNALLDGMVANGLAADGKDPGMKGVTRYVRLPEGRNTKAKYGPGGWTCMLTEWNPNRRFGMDDLGARWPIALPAPGTVSGTAGRAPATAAAATDLLFPHLDAWGMIGGPSADGKGFICECPWIGEHTQRADTGAAYYLGGGFCCHHGHGGEKGRGELVEWVDARLREESGGLVGLAAGDFGVVPGYRPPNAGARGKVVVAPTVGTGAGAAPAIDFGTGAAGRFFGELVYLREEDRFYDLRSDGLVSRIAVDLVWSAPLRTAGLLPVVVPRTGDTMPPTRWFFDEANTGRARIADRVTYWPGAPRFFHDDEDRTLVNTWRKPDRLALSVTDADVEPWMKLVCHLVGAEGPGAVEWVLDWMALVVGAPGVKPGWHLVVQGGQGIGKDMILRPVRVGVGEDNVGTVNAGGLHSQFNPWAARRLAIVNELKQNTRGSATGSDQYTILKELTENTSPRIKINQKNQREYYAHNVSAFYVTSNSDKAIALEADDRRFMFIMATAKPWPRGEFADLTKWLDGGGAELVAEWLHDRWDAMATDRRQALQSHAPRTKGKALMIANTEDVVTTWMREQIETGAWPDLMTSKDIAAAIAVASKSGVGGFSYPVAPSRWGAILTGLGGAKVYGGNSVRLKSGEKGKLWATRGPDRFTSLGEAQLAQAYTSAAGHAFSDDPAGCSVIKIRLEAETAPLPHVT